MVDWLRLGVDVSTADEVCAPGRLCRDAGEDLMDAGICVFMVQDRNDVSAVRPDVVAWLPEGELQLEQVPEECGRWR